ncbi:cobalt ECF transporter T component CbiQ [Rhodococcus sp. H36-A4]|uniref:cobalt ECF transporter T component CbiQ n=1 Tax=Rhodococcus sp. H36-A4 TaxID=3004353 RepID=UPI0022AE93E4|nr:cobalt ECF transporter T component CbiQ [Rhodococcus sp. H36-A4]MCZ4077129.1 cobalt ECF transporter T component CbiQ [Rhodococcus sp. H36-A4]
MGAGHAHPLYREGSSAVHRAPVEVKIVCALITVLAIVATPREMFWPFAMYALLLMCVWRWASIPLRWILPRMIIELPFVVLAVLLPFAEGGARVSVLGVSMSEPGLWAAWGIVVKGTLGVATSLTFAATTHARDLPLGLTRLRVPALVTTILVLMLRYIDLLAGEATRMRNARLSRGDSPRAIHQVGATARGVGGLFLRSYERGERVHLSMASRGFTGRIPDMPGIAGVAAPADIRSWSVGLVPAYLAVSISLCAWVFA